MTGRGRLGLLFSASLAMIYVVSVQKQWRSASLVERKSFQLSSRGDCAPSRRNRNTLPGQLSVPLMGLRWSMDRAEFKETVAAPWWGKCVDSWENTSLQQRLEFVLMVSSCSLDPAWMLSKGFHTVSQTGKETWS